MTDPATASTEITSAHPGRKAPTWGLGDAAAGWVIAYMAAVLVGGLVFAAAGYETSEDASLPVIALSYPPLWLGFVGIPIWAAATKGNGWIIDFRAHIRLIDVPIGIVIGVASQLLMVPLVSWPVLWLTDRSADDLAAPARELADKAEVIGLPGALLFLAIVGIGAPLAEELFYRGLVLRSFERRFGPWIAVALSSLWFGATHFQPLQFVALVVAGAIFAALAVRFDRLGPAVIAHMAFNTTTVVFLLWIS